MSVAIAGRIWRRLAIVVVLAAASVMLYRWAPQYRLVGEELLQNPDFAAGLDFWRSSGRVDAVEGTATLRNDVQGRIVGIVQNLANPAPGYYSFAGEVRPIAVVRGATGGNAARLVLASVDPAGDAHWEIPHTVVSLVGSGDWRRYAEVFKVPPASSAIWVIAQLFSATGTLEVRHLSVHRAEPLATFQYASRILLGLWIVAGFWIAWPLLAAARRDHRIAAVMLVGLAIGIATQMPNSAKTELLVLIRGVENRIGPVLQRPPTAAESSGQTPATSAPVTLTAAASAAEFRHAWHGLDKFGHYLMHVCLGMVTLWAFRLQPRAVVLLCLLCFSSVTEVWQNFAIDRDPLLSDAIINIGGALTGAVLTLVLLRLRKANPG